MNTQPDALELADALEYDDSSLSCMQAAATELRRQHRVIELLIADMTVVTQSRHAHPNLQRLARASIQRATEAA